MQNPQQNTHQTNTATHQKDNPPKARGIYPRDARMVQHTQIKKDDTRHATN